MLLDVSRALRSPGEEFPFVHEETIPPQDIYGEQIVFDDPVTMSGVFCMSGDSLMLRGELKCVAHALCANCLAPVAVPMVVPFDEVFVRVDRFTPQDEDDPDRLAFEGAKVALSHLALTLAVLNLPMRFVCREDCPGLMPAQSDISTQASQKETPDQHPFSALQSLLNEDLGGK